MIHIEKACITKSTQSMAVWHNKEKRQGNKQIT